MILFDKKPRINKIFLNKDFKLKIAHLPDFHINGISNINYLDIIQQVLLEKPDLIIYNGDIFNNYYKTENKIVEDLNIECKFGSFFVTGNREGFYQSENNIIKNLKKTINFLESNKLKELIHLEIDGLNIYGIRDYHASNLDFLKDIKKFNEEEISNSIIFCHNPIIQSHLNLDKCKNNIIICGHTHGGQIFPFGYVKLEKELQKIKIKRRGLHNLKNNNIIFIGNGVGYNHSKFRIFANNYIDILYY